MSTATTGAREWGCRFTIDGTVRTYSGRQEAIAAAEDAARLQLAYTEIVYRTGPEQPWQRYGAQQHTTADLVAALEHARDLHMRLSAYRGQRLVDAGIHPNPPRGGKREAPDPYAEIHRLRAALAIAQALAGLDPHEPPAVWIYLTGEDDDETKPCLTEDDARRDAITWWKSENPRIAMGASFQWRPIGRATHELHARGRATGIIVRRKTLRTAA